MKFVTKAFSFFKIHAKQANTLLNWKNLLLLCAVILGFFLYRDYGISWDEPEMYQYAESSVKAYSLRDRFNGTFSLESTFGPTDLRYYGPSYLVFWGKPVLSLLEIIFPQSLTIELWHLTNYLFYVFSAWLFYRLAAKFMSKKAALVSTLLFWSQPVLFGSSWFNPKDIPFLVFFIGAIYFGFTALEGLDAVQPLSLQHPTRVAKGRFTPSLGLLVILFAISVMIGFSFFFNEQIEAFIHNQIISIYQLDGDVFLRKLFDHVASLATPETLSLYSAKAIALFKRIRVFLLTIFVVLSVWGGIMRKFPGFWNSLYTSVRAVCIDLWKAYIKVEKGKNIFSLLLAAFFLGAASSIRIIGPLAGLLIVIFSLLRYRWKSFPLLVVYAGLAFLVMYISWPFLWGNTIEGLLFVLTRNTEFPTLYNILFNGVIYPSTTLPRSYLPTLLAITLTEISLPLFLFGVVLWGIDLFRKREYVLEKAVLLLWFLIPLLYVILQRPPLYDSYRHFYFVLPPIFLFCGFILDKLFKKISVNGLQTILVVVLLFPAFIGIVQLHPYEYAYYNTYAGGFRNAALSYEVDYWVTCYKELAQQMVLSTDPAENIYVAFTPDLVIPYVGDGYTVSKMEDISFPENSLIFLPRRWQYIQLYPEYPVAYEVEVNGVTLCVARGTNP